MIHAPSAVSGEPTDEHALSRRQGWVNVAVASLAMTATLPGRTHGLGLVTEPLLGDLRLDPVTFARINLVGTLLGAAFCFPAGWAIDRYGVRRVLAAIAAALGVAVVGMSRVDSGLALGAWLVLVRGLGQSALSVAAMAVISKWFRRGLGAAMGAFAVALTIGFIMSVLAMGAAVSDWGWRDAWQGLGLSVLALAPVFWLLARDAPASGAQLSNSLAADNVAASTSGADVTLREALATPAFWVILLGSSAFNLVWSGVTLFNEAILAERGLGPTSAVEAMAILTGVGLLANLACGKLATPQRATQLLGAGLTLLVVALVAYSQIEGAAGARVYAAAVGLCGGIITVVFFAAWGLLFGRAHLGRIQGAAQCATVLASAAGPWVVAEGRAALGSYAAAFIVLAVVVGALAIAAVFTPLPRTATEAGVAST
jgi:MFS family permease